jgi:hypothetical protein
VGKEQEMTREERHIAVLNRMLESMDVYDSIQPTAERKKAIKGAIQVLSQQPCDDDLIRRDAVFDGLKGCICEEWVKTLFATMVKQLPSVTQKPIECEDAISRQAAIDTIESWLSCDDYNEAERHIMRAMQSVLYDLPSVTQKSGKWIVDGSVDCYLDKVRCHCSKCGKKKEFPADYDHIKRELSISYKHPEFIDNFCPNCGERMESDK